METPVHQPATVATTSRRAFLRAAAATTLAAAVPHVHAGEDNTIKLALVGCGGRGTGATANALSTKGPTKLWAMADVFDVRLQPSLQALSKQFNKQVEVPKERQFLGTDGYKKAIDAIGPGGIVLLATPPAFRPMHLEYAVAKGCHVFMEKSFAVDAAGVRRVLKAGAEATKKNLAVAGGLMSRHYPPLEEAVRRIHEGAIGKVIAAYCYREHAPVGFTPKSAGESELAHQIRNYSNFTWLNGSFLLDWLIHDIDVCCWVKDAWPVSRRGKAADRSAPSPINCSTTMRWNTALPTARGCWPRAGTSPVAGTLPATSSMAPRARPSAAAGANHPTFTRAMTKLARI